MSRSNSVVNSNIVVLLTTVHSFDEAERIAQELVKQKLAFCVSISAAERSLYVWQEKLCNEQEWPLKIKTQQSHLQSILDWFEQEHPFDEPEFIVLKTEQSSQAYEQWSHEYLNS